MKTFSAISPVLFFLLLASTVCAEDQSTDFRKARWGMTVDEVKKTEQRKPDDELTKGSKTTLFYSDRVAGFACDVVYLFAYDKLVRAKYIFKEKHTNNNAYISDYSDVVSALSEKYGQPKSDKEYWDNELFKDKPDEWGTAISAGHMRKYAEWDRPQTHLLVCLKGDNFEIELGIEYVGNNFKELENKADKELEKGKL